MSFINCGAYINGRRAKTKKALREALKEDPTQVSFDCTSIMEEGRMLQGNDLPTGAKLSVVGPDPYTDRRFYATVERQGETVKVS